MILKVFDGAMAMGIAAGAQAALAIREAVRSRGKARIVAATGASQFHFLEALTAAPGIYWKPVEFFHLDEYIGLPMTPPGSFCKFLRARLIDKTGITEYHLLDGAA